MKIDPDIFLAAAEDLDRIGGEGVCYQGMCAVVKAEIYARCAKIGFSDYLSNWNECQDFMASYFRPKGRGRCDYWFGVTEKKVNIERRIIALLLLQELANEDQS